jgi:predicted nucleic acid-binding protein
MSADRWYVDSSALVKTILTEADSEALAAWLEGKDPLVACELVRVEVVRAVRASDPTAVARARETVDKPDLIALDDELCDEAALLDPPSLRSLDAIHLAAALSLGEDLAGVVTYDERLVEAARMRGLVVVSPC